jgi:predicted phosphodiesterase
VVDEAIARQAHLFIQAGDLFDSIEPRNLEREFVAAQLARLHSAGIQTFGISGNHDTPRQRTEHGGFAPQGIYAELGGIYYFPESDRIKPVLVDAAQMRVAVAGLSCNPGAAPGSDPLDGVVTEDAGNSLARADIGILILHAAIEGHGFPSEDESIVRRESFDRISGFKLILAGHVHAFARFEVADKSVVVCGPTERMSFGEAEDKTGFAYLEIHRDGHCHAEHVAIPPQPRHIVTIQTSELWPRQPQQILAPADSMTTPIADAADISRIATAGATSDAISAAYLSGADATGRAEDAEDAEDDTAPLALRVVLDRIRPYCTPDAMVRLCLTGPISREQYRTLDLRKVWLTAQQQAFSFELDESGLFLGEQGSREQIVRGERIAPREMLEQVMVDRMDHAETAAERTVLAKTRERVLTSYEQLTGGESVR